MLKSYRYKDYNERPEVLANRIIDILEQEGNLSFPINPFYLLKRFNISYKLMDFEDLEGLYIVPSDDKDIALVGINRNRPIKRQRFTAAHEICHHIKDRELEIITCPIDGRKNNIEHFADKFASELLMPTRFLKAEANKYMKNGHVTLEDALKISLFFGVSFQACVYALAYKLDYLDGDIESSVLKRRISQFKPINKIEQLDLKENYLFLYKQLIDDYTFIDLQKNDFLWYKLKNNYIVNEEHLEGSNLETDFINEIITDIRLKQQDSEYCTSEYQNVIETVGQAKIFDFIFEQKSINVDEPLKHLHKKLYSYMPYPEFGGQYRDTNNYVHSSNVETVNYFEIYRYMYDVDLKVKHLSSNSSGMKISEYIEQVIIIHHEITKIHPFADGNGRSSRGLINWLFRVENLYPVYVDISKKEEYYNALSIADNENNLEPLIIFFIEALIDTDILLNKFSLMLDL